MPEPRLPADESAPGVGSDRSSRTHRRPTRCVCTGEVTVDFGAAMARKDALIDGWVDGYTESLGHTDGLALIHGQGRFSASSDRGPRDGRGRDL